MKSVPNVIITFNAVYKYSYTFRKCDRCATIRVKSSATEVVRRRVFTIVNCKDTSCLQSHHDHPAGFLLLILYDLRDLIIRRTKAIARKAISSTTSIAKSNVIFDWMHKKKKNKQTHRFSRCNFVFEAIICLFDCISCFLTYTDTTPILVIWHNRMRLDRLERVTDVFHR